MKERLLAMQPLLLRLVGYPVFFLFWFVLFVYVTFPYDRVKELIVAQIEAPHRVGAGQEVPSNMQISIGKLGPTIFPGVHARDVTLTFLPSKSGEKSSRTHLDNVTVHVGLFSLLFGTLNTDLDIEGLGGTIRGHVEQAIFGPRPGLRAAEIKIERIGVGQLAPVVAMVGLPLAGQIDGNIELNMPDGQLDKATGSVRFTIDDLRLGDGHAQYQIPNFGSGGVTVEQIRAGKLEGSLTLRNGTATIDRLAARSNEFALATDGRIELAQVLGESRIESSVRFRLTDVYRNKSEQAGRIMMVMDSVPDLQSAKRADGMFGFRCTGLLEGNLRCMPDQHGGSSRGARRGFEP